MSSVDYDPKKNPFSYKSESRESEDIEKQNAGLILWFIITVIIILLSI